LSELPVSLFEWRIEIRCQPGHSITPRGRIRGQWHDWARRSLARRSLWSVRRTRSWPAKSVISNCWNSANLAMFGLSFSRRLRARLPDFTETDPL